MIARLIGERSAGMVAVEIWDADNLVWSHMWFADGATSTGYINGLADAARCILDCDDYDAWDGNSADDNDGVCVQYDNVDTTGVVLEYDSETQQIGEVDRSYGLGGEIIDALMLLGTLDPDDEHDDHTGDDERAIAALIGAV